jgi:hypothetical protein
LAGRLSQPTLIRAPFKGISMGRKAREIIRADPREVIADLLKAYAVEWVAEDLLEAEVEEEERWERILEGL